MPATLAEIRSYLDDYLEVDRIPDYPGAVNGLQVEGRGEVRGVAAAVDACRFTIEEAARREVDLLLVHHGLFWGAPQPWTGARYRRLEALVQSGLAVYSSHLPLDVHPEVGNNPLLAQELGMRVTGEFAQYRGVAIGRTGRFDGTREELVCRVSRRLGCEPAVYPFGPERVEHLAILTGSGGSSVAEAAARGADTFVTGEGTHPSFFDAEENGINLILAGHYATETVGVRALAAHVAERFSLPAPQFIDHPTGL